jgi:hypothetical protein
MTKRKEVVKQGTPEVPQQVQTVPTAGSVAETKIVEAKKVDEVYTQVEKQQKEVHRCDQCVFFDVGTLRKFREAWNHPEMRAICRGPETVRSSGHLVKNDSNKECYVQGVYQKSSKKAEVS